MQTNYSESKCPINAVCICALLKQELYGTHWSQINLRSFDLVAIE